MIYLPWSSWGCSALAKSPCKVSCSYPRLIGRIWVYDTVDLLLTAGFTLFVGTAVLGFLLSFPSRALLVATHRESDTTEELNRLTDSLTDTDWLTHPPPYVEFCPWATHLALMISLPLYHWLTNFYPYSGPFSSDTSECLLGVPTRSSTCLDVLRSSQTESHKTQLPFTSIMPFHMVPPYPLSHCVNLWAVMVLDWSLPNSILGRSRAGTTYFISVTLHSVHWVCSINMWDSGSKEDEGKQERMEPIWDSSVPDRNHN